MFKTMFLITEKNCVGQFNGEPYEYLLETEKYPTGKQIQDLLFQAVEIEGISSECLVQMTVECDGEYFSGDECVMTCEVVRTEEPSKYVQWGDKEPHIFSVDREKSSLRFEVM